jgi:hypothetical protein
MSRIANLQAMDEFEELTDTDSMMIVGGTSSLDTTAGILYNGAVNTAATT